MSEKVLGYTIGNAKLMLRLFREQQKKHGNTGCFCSECEQDMRLALREYDKLVPVVSLEALETAFEKLLDEIALSDSGSLSSIVFGDALEIKKRIMGWAKKEAKK